MNEPSPRFTLRCLALPARVVLASFLICVGFGYFSALVQLHFQHASPGKLLPDKKDAIDAYGTDLTKSTFERVLEAHEKKPFNGSGSMASAFTFRGGLAAAVNRVAKEKKISKVEAEKLVRKERDGERLSLVLWARKDADQAAFADDNFPLTGDLDGHPITEKYLVTGENGERGAMIQSIIRDRCARCHNKDFAGPSASFPLEEYEDVLVYATRTTPGGMSLTKLAQSTHVHLLGFSMLYGLTGLIFTFTSFPTWMRLLLGPLPLLAQFVDISFWWLARFDPMFAGFIAVSGGVVALGLGAQILLSLWHLFGKTGRVVLLVLMAATLFVGYQLWVGVIEPHLKSENGHAASTTTQ